MQPIIDFAILFFLVVAGLFDLRDREIPAVLFWILVGLLTARLLMFGINPNPLLALMVVPFVVIHAIAHSLGDCACSDLVIFILISLNLSSETLIGFAQKLLIAGLITAAITILQGGSLKKAPGFVWFTIWWSLAI